MKPPRVGKTDWSPRGRVRPDEPAVAPHGRGRPRSGPGLGGTYPGRVPTPPTTAPATPTVAVLLAAGAGTRLGRGPKALLPHRGGTLVEHATATLLAGGCDAVVVVLGALMHDLGMAIHRDDHERFSLILATMKLRELLDGIYDVAARTVIMSEVLHAIISHRSDGRPLTLEAGVVRIADALDIAKGRSRIAFEAGKINIHSLSAAAIDHIEIQQGDHKPVRIVVDMLNSAGVFQIDELLKEKLSGSGLEPYMEIVATIKGETEKKLVEVFRV